MDYIIREMKSEEYCLLSDFLYEAVYIPDGIEPPPKSVIEDKIPWIGIESYFS